jgi:hypothetical protein
MMRIIIESNEREHVKTFGHAPRELGQVENMDGGAPSEMLIQTIEETFSMPNEVATAIEGIGGGSPPEWLVEAIDGANQARIKGSNADTDAGGAPRSEG